MIKPSVSIRGKLTTPIQIKGKTNTSIIKPKLETAEVTPGTEDQTLISSVDGFSAVLVKGDANLLEENIKSGITIFGKQGKSANTSDATAVANNLDKGIVAYSKNDERIVGTGKVLDTEVIYTVPYVNQYGTTGLGKIISTSEYLPIVYHGTYGIGGDMGKTELFPVSKLPIDISGKNIMFRIYFKRPTYNNSPHYYLTAELYIASSMDNRFEVRRDSSNDLVWCWNNANKESRVSYTYYVFSKYLGNTNDGEVAEGTIDDITSDGWETGTATSRGSYSSGPASMYKFCSKDMVTSGGLAGITGYVGRGDDCFLQTTFGKDISKYGGDYKIQNGGTLITRIPNEDIANAIGLVPENIKEGSTYLGVDGVYKGTDTSDATATANDILQGKIAYSNNEKIEGTIETYDGAYSGNGENANEWEEIFANLIDNSREKNVTKLPNGINKIRNYAFYRNNSLRLIELPESVTDIGLQAFYNCGYLALTKLPDNLKTIGESTFYGCSSLALSKLPDGITQIPKYTFYNCKNLALTELPSNLTSIEVQGFYNCTSLTELTCKGDLKDIAAYAFYSCSNLRKLVLENVTNTPNLLNINAFDNTPIANGTGYIYVPDNLVNSFKTATNWSNFANQIKPISELEV